VTSQPEVLQLRDYLRPIVQRKWLVLLIVLLATGGVYAYYAHKPKVYEASTKVLITPTANPLDPSSSDLSDRDVQNQAALLTSRDVATTVARRLGRRRQAADLAASVTAQALSGSDFVVIAARRAGASDAARVANAFAKAFIDLRTKADRKRLSQALAVARAQLAQIPDTSSNAANRASLLVTIRQLQLTRSVSSRPASRVDPAVPPGAALGPHTFRSTALAFVLSLIGAIGLAYGLEAFDRRVRRLEEFAPLYGMPILAVIPHSEEVAIRNDGRAALSPAFKEPLRQLRTNIQLSSRDRPVKRILVTSAIAGEGKSTLVRNLAIVFREGGLRVAVVDSDLRRPALARLFNEQAQPGLTDVLTGRQSLDDALVTVPVQVRGLGTLAQIGAVSTVQTKVISFLASGPQPPDPQTVLAADRTRVVLQAVGADHDIVLIDSPPLLHVTDAVTLASWVDAVIVVARLGWVTRDNARRLSEVLGTIPGAHPIGVVLNDVPPAEGAGYGFAYGYDG
jgi:capsular exopolysaccharide synthesis family protein